MGKRVPQRKNSLLVGGVIAVAVAIAAVFVVQATRIANRPTLRVLLEKDDRCSIFRRIYEKSDFPNFGKVPGQWTLFVPLDSGFEKLPKFEVDQAFNDQKVATMIVARHLIRGSFPSEKLRHLTSLENVRRFFLHIRVGSDKRIFVDDHSIVEPDVMASNGVMHILDHPLPPEH